MVTVAELTAKLDVKDGGAQKRLKGFSLSLTDVKAGLELVAGAARFAADAIRSFTTDIAAQGDELAKSAKNLGINVVTLQEFGFAAQISGSDVKTFEKSVQTMNKGLNLAARTGAGAFKDSLEQINLTVEDLEGLDPAAKFTKIAQALSVLTDESEKSAVAQELFGKGGKTLLPLINEGAAGIAKLRAEFRELGGGFTEDGAAAAEEFNDSMLRVATVVDSFKIQVGTELLPIIGEYADEFKEWLLLNKDFVKEKISEFVDRFIRFVKQAVPKILDMVEGIIDLIEAMGGAERAIKIIIAGFIALKIATAAATRAAIAATGPYGILAAAAFAAGAAIGTAMGSAGDEVDALNRRISVLQANISETTKKTRELKRQVRETESGNERIRREIEQRKQKVTRGFAPELVSGEGLPSATAEKINAEIERQISVSVKKRVTKIEKRLKRSGLDADKARLRAVESGIALTRELQGRRAEARKAASEAFLAGGRAREVRRAITGQVVERRAGGKKRGGGKRGAGAQTPAQREFEDLLDADKLRQRVAEGQVTPTILITVTNFNVTQNIDAPLSIQGLSSTTASEVVAMIQRQFDEMQEGALRRGVQDVESRVAR